MHSTKKKTKQALLRHSHQALKPHKFCSQDSDFFFFFVPPALRDTIRIFMVPSMFRSFRKYLLFLDRKTSHRNSTFCLSQGGTDEIFRTYIEYNSRCFAAMWSLSIFLILGLNLFWITDHYLGRSNGLCQNAEFPWNLLSPFAGMQAQR